MMLNKKPLWAVTLVTIPILLASTGLFTQSNRLRPIDTSVPEAAKSDIDMQKKVRTRLGQTPMAFERNQGQTDTQVKFLSRGLGYALFLTPTEAVFKLEGASEAQGQGENAIVRMALVGASNNPTMVGRDLQKSQSNHFRGQDPSRWQTNVNRYGKVEYSNVYPGVDLVYYGNQQQLEYDFIVAPGRDPQQIALRFDGMQSRKLDAQGNLILGTEAGELVQRKPLVYQDINGRRHTIDSRYQLLADNRIGFQIGRYDHSEPLVIDPIMEFGATFGGTLNDRAYSVAVDRAGYIYIAGMTVSDDFPTVAAIKPTKQQFSNNEAFVSKINAAGNTFIYSTYFGGNAGGDDEIRGVAVDATGSVYITGITYSTAFPLIGAIQATKGSFADAFVTKINAAGNMLVYSTYLGGNSHDYGYGIAVNAAGEAYVVGTTQSTDFPTAAARQVANGGGGDRDAFVSKLNASGSAFVFSTYHGGAFSDYGYAIALDTAGNAYITGETDSTNFPLASAKQAVKGTFFDAFISKISANGSTLTYSTYLGGSDYDRGFGIAVDKTGAAYVTGETGSLNFPIFNAYQTTKGLSTTTDAFITKYVPAGNAFAYSTYLGGSGHDYARAIAIDPAGNAYVTGDTRSNNFPVTAAMQPAYGGDGYDSFITKLNGSGSKLLYSSYFGDSLFREYMNSIAVDIAGNSYIAGYQEDSSNAFSTDAIFAKISLPITASWRGDFDADGKSDILWRNRSTGQNVIWKSGNSATPTAVKTLSDLNIVIAGVGDFNGDGKSDILWRNLVSGGNFTWHSGDANTSQAITAWIDTNWKVAGIGDFNGDGKSDILWRNYSTGGNTIWHSANYATRIAITGFTDLGWELVGVGNFNGDSKSDLLWRHSSTGANLIWFSASSATKQTITTLSSQSWRVANVADFDGDGKSDILWRNSLETGANIIWKSGLSSTNQTLTTMGNLAFYVGGVGDYNGDGKADIFWRNTSTRTNIIWRSANSATTQAVSTVNSYSWVPSS